MNKFKVNIQTQMETKPIYYGKAPSADLQDYALTAYSFEEKDSWASTFLTGYICPTTDSPPA